MGLITLTSAASAACSSSRTLCRYLSYGRQGRWSQAYAAANGRFTHYILGNEVQLHDVHAWLPCWL